jgi:hypothetical protein
VLFALWFGLVWLGLLAVVVFNVLAGVVGHHGCSLLDLVDLTNYSCGTKLWQPNILLFRHLLGKFG